METINLAMAKIALITTIILAILFVLNRRRPKEGSLEYKFKGFIKRNHKVIGVICILAGGIHGYFSSFDILSFNFGTFTWIVSMLLGLNFMFRKHQKGKGWMFYHRILSVLMMILLIIHLIEIRI